MDAFLNDLIWINNGGLVFLKHNFPNSFKCTTIQVYHLGSEGVESVRSNDHLLYEQTFHNDGRKVGFSQAYTVTLHLDNYNRAKFDIYYEAGVLKYMYADYHSIRYNDWDIAIEVKDFLSQVYDDVREIHTILSEI